MGPSHVASTNGSLYYASFVDVVSKYTWVYLISHKSQATSIFLQFKALVENQTGFSSKTLQINNAKEFLLLTKLLNTYDIIHRLTCPHTHQQNDSVERKHCHIVDTGLALLVAASLPLRFQGDAFSSVVFTINILPTPVLHNLSQYEMLFSHKPDLITFTLNLNLNVLKIRTKHYLLLFVFSL